MPIRTGVPQGLDRALAAPCEVEVVADHHVAHAEPVHQQALHELVGAHALHAPVETQHHDAVHAVQRERLQFLAQAREARRRGGASEEFARRRLEGDHHGRHAERVGPGAHRRDHVLVPAVHAVVVADGRDAAAMPLAQVVHPSDQFHRRCRV
jgi:hypothetical protein